MATFDSEVMSTISNWAEYDIANNHALKKLAMLLEQAIGTTNMCNVSHH